MNKIKTVTQEVEGLKEITQVLPITDEELKEIRAEIFYLIGENYINMIKGGMFEEDCLEDILECYLRTIKGTRKYQLFLTLDKTREYRLIFQSMWFDSILKKLLEEFNYKISDIEVPGIMVLQFVGMQMDIDFIEEACSNYSEIHTLLSLQQVYIDKIKKQVNDSKRLFI